MFHLMHHPYVRDWFHPVFFIIVFDLMLKAYPNHSSQSPEVTSKVASGEVESDSVKSISEKLSAALLNISAKEELVKQHAKVTEEAVSGIIPASLVQLQLDD